MYSAQTISGLLLFFCENALKAHWHGFWMRCKSQSGSVVAPEGWKPLQASMTKISLFVLALHYIYGLSLSGTLLIFLAVTKMGKATLSFYFPVMNSIYFANFHCILFCYSGSIYQGKLCRDYATLSVSSIVPCPFTSFSHSSIIQETSPHPLFFNNSGFHWLGSSITLSHSLLLA